MNAGAQLVVVIRDAAAGAAELNDARITIGKREVPGHGLQVALVGDDDGPRKVEADLEHRLLEQLAVLGLADRLEACADDLDAVFLGGFFPAAANPSKGLRGLPAQSGEEWRPVSRSR